MRKLILGMAVLASTLAMTVTPAKAAEVLTLNNFNLTQTVEDPPIRLFVRGPDGKPVNDLSVAFPLRTSSVTCLVYGDGAPAGILGTENQPVLISIPKTYDGWTLTVRSMDGVWTGGDSRNLINIDDATNNGCSRRQNSPANSGQGGLLYLDPTNIKVHSDCVYDCQNNSPIVSPVGDFQNWNGKDVTVLSSSVANAGWQGTISGIRLVQTMPANLKPDNYTLPMLLCLEAL